VDELAFAPATRLAGLLRRGSIGSLELLRHYLARVDAYNPAVNAVVVTDVARAERRARAADRALARGERWGPLHGVPITVKEAFDVAGLPTTWGLPEHVGNVPTSTAVVVERLIAAGAIVFGKTNVPAWVADGQTFNPVYGVTNNPWDLERTPGGSSGGSAAALSAGLTALEVGSDIASSIRNPAHFCGVFGHKPTFGICPQRGHSVRGRLAGDDLNVAGPLARSAHDLEVALRVMAGPDALDAAALRVALPRPRHRTLSDYRVGLIVSDPVADVDAAVVGALETLAGRLTDAGVTVDRGARPDLDLEEVKRIYTLLLHSATSHRQTDAELAASVGAIEALRASGAPIPAPLLGRTLRHRDWLDLHEAREAVRWRWHEFFSRWDLLLAPVRPVAAHRHLTDVAPADRTYVVNGVERPHVDQVFWGGYAGVAYLPATVAPIATTDDGLPVGVQIIGPFGGDLTCLHFARLLEREIGGFTPPIAYRDPPPPRRRAT
jgi:amidase